MDATRTLRCCYEPDESSMWWWVHLNMRLCESRTGVFQLPLDAEDSELAELPSKVQQLLWAIDSFVRGIRHVQLFEYGLAIELKPYMSRWSDVIFSDLPKVLQRHFRAGEVDDGFIEQRHADAMHLRYPFS